MFNLHHKLPHDPSAILRGISLQYRAEYFDSLFARPVICCGAEVADMRAKLVDDFLNVLQLLRGEVGIVEQPVKFFAVFMLCSHQIYGAVYQTERFNLLTLQGNYDNL